MPELVQAWLIATVFSGEKTGGHAMPWIHPRARPPDVDERSTGKPVEGESGQRRSSITATVVIGLQFVGYVLFVSCHWASKDAAMCGYLAHFAAWALLLTVLKKVED